MTFSLSADVTHDEGNSGTTSFLFTVDRTGLTTVGGAVDWSVTGFGASPASAADFVGAAFPSGTVIFAANETSKALTVQVRGDAAIEPDEDFVVTLANPRASGGAASATPIKTAAAGFGSVTSATATFAASGTASAGNLLVAALSSTAVITGLTPPSGWTAGPANGTGSAVDMATFWRVAAGGETGVSLSWTSGGGFGEIMVSEFPSAFTALDGENDDESKASTTGQTVSVGTVTATEAGLAVAFVTGDQAANVWDGRSYSNGYTERAAQSSSTGRAPILMSSKLLSGAGATDTTFTTTDTGDELYGCQLVFRAASGGSGISYAIGQATRRGTITDDDILVTALEDVDFSPIDLALDPAADSVTIDALPANAPIIGLYDGTTFTPVAEAQVLTLAEAETLHASRVAHRTWMDPSVDSLIVTEDVGGTTRQITRSFRMTVPWFVERTPMSASELDLTLRTWRYQHLVPNRQYRCWWLRLAWANDHGDWYDAGAVPQGASPYATVTMTSNNSVRTADVTSLIEDAVVEGSHPCADGSTADLRFANMVLKSSNAVVLHSRHAATAAYRPTLVFKNGGSGGSVIATNEAVFNAATSTNATPTDLSAGNPATLSFANSNYDNTIFLEFDVPPLGTWDYAELQLTASSGAASEQIKLFRPRNLGRVSLGSLPAADPSATASDVLMHKQAEGDWSSLVPSGLGDPAAISPYFTADNALQPGSGRCFRWIDERDLFLINVPRYADGSTGRTFFLPKTAGGSPMAKADQPYLSDVWLRFDLYLAPSFEFAAWNSANDDGMGGGGGKGLGLLACTFEAEAPGGYDPGGAMDPRNLIGYQKGGYGGGETSDAVFTPRLHFAGILPEGHPLKGFFLRSGLYVYYREKNQLRISPSTVAFTQQHSEGTIPWPIGSVFTVTMRVKMNTHTQHATYTDMNGATPIYSVQNGGGAFRGNGDGEVFLYLNDDLITHDQNLVLSDLPNFGIREVAQIGTAYLGGLLYGDTTDADRQIHLLGVGNCVASLKPLGLDPVPV